MLAAPIFLCHPWLMSDPNAIPEHRRQLYLRILDNYRDFHPITQRFYFLDDHFPPPKLDKALRWLVENNYTGIRFLNWFKQVCSNSDLEMHRNLLMVVNNEELPKVVAGKNFHL